MKINVVQFIGSINRGGAENLVLDVCHEYPVKLGTMHLFTYKGGNLEKQFITNKTPYHKTTKGFLALPLFFRLRSYLKQHHIAIVHVHKSLDAIYARIASIGLPVKIVQTYHSLGHGLGYRVLRNIVPGFVARTLFVSSDILSKYTALHPVRQNYSVLYNAINPQKLTPKGKGIREELQIGKDTPLFGMVGNFNRVRDHFTVCKALNVLQHKKYKFHFLFVGSPKDKELYDQCHNFCRENGLLSAVSFLGIRQDIADILMNLDIFVYSSNTDTFGIALVEAMMAGTPVITNDLPIFKEIADNGEFALMYKSKNADELAEKIIALSESNNHKTMLSHKAKNYALEKFSISKHVALLYDIYLNILTGNEKK